MAEERSGAQPLEEGRGQQGRTASRGQQSRRQRSVFQYVAILFAAALVLLFYTYMMEQRQFEQLQRENQENIDDLRQSVSAVQTLQGMTEENKLLKEQNQELEARLQALEERLDTAEQDREALQTRLQSAGLTVQAMDWFWQIDEAYVRGRYAQCGELIQDLEDAQLADWLPTESITDNGRFSPADRYLEIREKVMR